MTTHPSSHGCPRRHTRDTTLVHAKSHLSWRPTSSEFSRLTLKFFPPFLASTPQSGVAPSDIGDIVMGSVLGSGSQRANECRIAMFYAGFPEEVPVRVVNRQCSSGLQAIADVVASIRCAPRLPSPPLHTSRSRADPGLAPPLPFSCRTHEKVWILRHWHCRRH